jgi:hypothetical protein
MSLGTGNLNKLSLREKFIQLNTETTTSKRELQEFLHGKALPYYWNLVCGMELIFYWIHFTEFLFYILIIFYFISWIDLFLFL